MLSLPNRRELEARGAAAVGDAVAEHYELDRRIASKIAAIMAVEETMQSPEDSELVELDPRLLKLLTETAFKAAILSRTMEQAMEGTFPWSTLGIEPDDVARIIQQYGLMPREDFSQDG